MSAPTGPSYFVDIYAMTFTPTSGTAVNVYAIKSVSINRSRQILRGQDNNKLRTVAVHTVGIEDTVTLNTEDFNALNSLLDVSGPGVLVFNGRAAAHQYTNDAALADTTVTISGLVFDKQSIGNPSKQLGSGSLSGFVMEAAAGDTTDPIVIVPATSPPADTAN